MAAPPSPSFAELLRQYREAAGLTQEELAERADLSERAISDLERGVRRRPQTYTLQALADALELMDAERTHFVAVAKGRATLNGLRPTTTIPQEREQSGPPFVGRTHELGLVQQHLDGNAPPVLMLAGEPGIGKSRLLGEAARRARSAGWTVLVAGCQRWGSEEPYTPLRAAVQEQIRTLSPADRRVALAGCAWLVHLLPELAAGPIEPLPAWTAPPDQIRRLMFEATARFLRHVAGPRGTLLVLDDLQWAGKDALDLLVALVQAPEAAVRVVGAYRDTEAPVDGPLATLLSDLARAGGVQHCALAPLSPSDAQELAGYLLPGTMAGNDAIRARVVQRTGGVPFFVVSCTQALGLDQTAQRDGATVPWDVAQSVRQRVAALAAATRTVLAVAAVVGRAVRPDILVDVTGDSEDEVLDALDAAYVARLLDEDDDGYRFAHDLVREVVEADVRQSRRAILHRRIAESLERMEEPAPPDLIAYHYGRSDAPRRALPYLERAGEQAEARSAIAAAAGYYRELVDRLDGLGRTHEAARIREKLAPVLIAMAQHDAALQTLEQAVTVYRAVGDTDGLGRVVGQIGRVHTSKGAPDEGIQYILPLLAEMEGRGQSTGLAAVYAALPNLYYFKGAYAERLAAATRAAELARTVGDERNLLRAEFEHGAALADLGRVAEARDVLEGARQRAEALDDLLNLRRILFMASESYMRQGECETARDYLARTLAIAERLGEAAQIAYATAQRSRLAFVLGQWDQARADCERAMAMSRPLGASYATLYTLLQAGRLYVALGAWQEATQHLEECLSMSERGGTFETARGARAALAERDLLCGDPRTADAHLAPLANRPRLEELPLLAWTHLALGRVEQAADVVAEAVARASAGNDRLTLIEACWVQGMVLVESEHTKDAAQVLDQGLTLTRVIPYPYATARLLYVAGLLLAKQQDCVDLARERLAEALALFRTMGALWYVEQVTQALARCHT